MKCDCGEEFKTKQEFSDWQCEECSGYKACFDCGELFYTDSITTYFCEECSE